MGFLAGKHVCCEGKQGGGIRAVSFNELKVGFTLGKGRKKVGWEEKKADARVEMKEEKRDSARWLDSLEMPAGENCLLGSLGSLLSLLRVFRTCVRKVKTVFIHLGSCAERILTYNNTM